MTTRPDRPNRTPIIQRSKRRLPEASNEAPTLNDMPAVGQGRNRFHVPRVNRDALTGVVLVTVPWLVILLLVHFGPDAWNAVMGWMS